MATKTTDRTKLIAVRLPEKLLQEVEGWRAQRQAKTPWAAAPTLTDAIRELVWTGLVVGGATRNQLRRDILETMGQTKGSGRSLADLVATLAPKGHSPTDTAGGLAELEATKHVVRADVPHLAYMLTPLGMKAVSER